VKFRAGWARASCSFYPCNPWQWIEIARRAHACAQITKANVQTPKNPRIKNFNGGMIPSSEGGFGFIWRLRLGFWDFSETAFSEKQPDRHYDSM
jgi:hypothetical protein